jgi:hypothetical protein
MQMILMKLNLMKSKMEEGDGKIESLERIERIVRQVEKTEANYRVDESA